MTAPTWTSPHTAGMVRGYLEAAWWTSEDTEPGLAEATLAMEAYDQAVQACIDFAAKAGADLDGMDPCQVGHDFWLTRNHHGAGFWDRGLGELGDRLTTIAEGFGESDLYLGDDGKVYFSC